MRPIVPCSDHTEHVCRGGDRILHHLPLDRPDENGETEYDVTDQYPYSVLGSGA